MAWLNYHHLQYFWDVARSGGVSQASRKLRVAPSTVSAQMRMLEEQLGEELFTKQGRRLVLTETGRVVFAYADQIFGLGKELLDVVMRGAAPAATPFMVGLSQSVPKLVAYRLLEPALALKPPMRVVCDEDKPERLFAELSVHALDLVIHDGPLPAGRGVRAYSHLLGETEVGIFAAPALAREMARGFPRSIERFPVLLPAKGSDLRGQLERFFIELGISPRVRGEFTDSALLKMFGRGGAGAFAGPLVIRDEIEWQYGVRLVGRLDGLTERYYAISGERRIKHPAVAAVATAARTRLFD
ncbi:MAG: LysR family transcriptional regulator [Polyangiaceae bacterium]|nr:LysR family transcriptional regulator [Polyangiaceae bacterium]